MNQYIIFDCYQTLIYKKNLEKIVKDFCFDVLKKDVPICYIERGYDSLYDRYKFKHPRFETPEEHLNFYIGYNKELFRIIGFSVSSYQATQLYEYLKKAIWEVYPDTLTALEDLKTKKISMGLLANWTKTLDTVLESIRLTHYFDFIYSSHDLKIEKPNPKIFAKALSSIEGRFEKIYYVGNDYELDIIPAKAAGLIPILIDRNNRYPASVDCLRIETLTNLSEILIWK